MSRQKFKKKEVFIVIFTRNVTTKVCNSTDIRNWKKRKLFGMSRQCRTPSKVAHVIRTLSQSTWHIYLSKLYATFLNGTLADSVGLPQAVADPGFPGFFPKNLHENERNWTGKYAPLLPTRCLLEDVWLED